MKRSYALIASILVGSTGVLVGCGGDDNGGGVDSGGGDTIVQNDTGKADNVVPTDGGKDGPASDSPMGNDADAGNVGPAGKQLATGDGPKDVNTPGDLQIFGITSDGLVIFADGRQASSLFAVDAAGASAPVKIFTPTSGFIAGISGKVVFVWDALDMANVGTVHFWKSGGTYVAGPTKSFPNAGFAASADGTKVIVSTNTVGPDGGTSVVSGDFVGLNSDGTGSMPLVTNVDYQPGCQPQVGFAGGVNAVTATCAMDPGDGGTPVASVTSYSTTWTAQPVATNVLNFWASDTAGDSLLVGTSTELTQFPIAGGTADNLDGKDVGNGGFAYMTHDGKHAFYAVNATGALYSSPIPAGTIIPLQASGVKAFRGLSADEGWMIYSTTINANTGAADLYLTSTTAAGAATTLATMNGSLFGFNPLFDNFTADSKFVLFITNLNATNGVGDLNYQSVMTGSTPKVISTGSATEWQNFTLTAQKIAFDDNCSTCAFNAMTNIVVGAGDLKVVDFSAATPTPTTLQGSIDPNFYVSPDKKNLIYTYSQNMPTPLMGADGGVQPVPMGGNGMYTVPAP